MILAQTNARYDFSRGELPLFVQAGAKYRRASRDIDVNDLVALTTHRTNAPRSIRGLLSTACPSGRAQVI
jgi:hypothetical protein